MTEAADSPSLGISKIRQVAIRVRKLDPDHNLLALMQEVEL